MTWKQRLLWVPPVKRQRHYSAIEWLVAGVLQVLAMVILFATLPNSRWTEVVVIVGTYVAMSILMIVVHGHRARRKPRRPSPGVTAVAK